ncbi:MAG: sensor histidine kinase [Gemmatimonadaceae bacterium]
MLIGGFLLAATTALSVAGYFSVRKTSLEAGEARIARLAGVYLAELGRSATGLRDLAMSAAASPAVIAFARKPEAALRAAAVAAMQYAGPQPENMLATALVDRDGRVLLSHATDDRARMLSKYDVAYLLTTVDRSSSAHVGRLEVTADTMFFPTAAKVPGTDGVFLVHWRRLALAARTREQAALLLGGEATVLIGNSDGSAWSDLERVIPPPPLYHEAVERATAHLHDGERFLVRALQVPGSEFLIAVESKYSALMSPVTQYLRQMGAIALFVVIIGLIGAWWMSRSITRPLTQLTDAASRIAQGDYALNVSVQRADELGKLASAFSSMSEQLRQSRDELEGKVAARTTDLNTTLQQLHAAQESLLRRERMATLGQLASGVGHELRNPLGVMTNAVYYLRAVLAAQPPNVTEYLDILHQQITLSEKIVADLLDYARAKAPHRVPTDMGKVLQTQLAQLEAMGRGRTAISISMPADLPPALADATQAGQVLLNLLTNAVQAMDGEGAITVRGHVADGCVTLDVADSGPGVAPELLERIFEPLFTTKARGIGLGLALSRTLARANGGDVSARNGNGATPPGGAVFSLSLPVAPAGAA